MYVRDYFGGSENGRVATIGVLIKQYKILRMSGDSMIANNFFR